MPCKDRLFAALLALLPLCDASSAHGDDLEQGSSRLKASDVRTTLVLLSSLVEVYSMYHEPVPYYGLGHFLQRDWSRGVTYLGTEYALARGESHFDKRRGLGDFNAHQSQSSESVYYRRSARGFSPQQFEYASYAQLASQTLFYVRLIDIYDAYRRLHAQTASVNKVKMNEENLPTLLSSPFRWKYLRNPWVNVPVILAAVAAYALNGSDRSLLAVDEAVALGSRRSPSELASVEAGLQSYRYVMVAAGEEMFFRGIVQTELTERTNPNLAVLLSAVLFGAWHVPNNGLGSALSAGAWGSYVGYRNRENGYDIGEGIAQHFWLNFVSRTIEFARNPKTSRLVYSITWKM